MQVAMEEPWWPPCMFSVAGCSLGEPRPAWTDRLVQDCQAASPTASAGPTITSLVFQLFFCSYVGSYERRLSHRGSLSSVLDIISLPLSTHHVSHCHCTLISVSYICSDSFVLNTNRTIRNHDKWIFLSEISIFSKCSKGRVHKTLSSFIISLVTLVLCTDFMIFHDYTIRSQKNFKN